MRVDVNDGGLVFDKTTVAEPATFGDIDPTQITYAEVQAWVAASGLKASSTRQYMITLRAVLD